MQDHKQNVPILHIGCATYNVTTLGEKSLHNSLTTKTALYLQVMATETNSHD